MARKFAIAVLVAVSGILFYIGDSLAKTDLSIIETDITFSKEEPVVGETIRIFGRVFNLGDSDVYGFVIFLDKGKELAEPQPISVKVNTYDDVFIDWQAVSGDHEIQAKIIGTNLPDENAENNLAFKNNLLVDLDTDGDKIGNNKDTDDDNDGFLDKDEYAAGTDPLDPASLDSDLDGLLDDDELFAIGSNPLAYDTDGDGLSDGEEVNLGTSVLSDDTDRDGVIDSKDKFPLDPQKAQASLMEAANAFMAKAGLSPKFLALLASLLLITLFIFFRRWRTS